MAKSYNDVKSRILAALQGGLPKNRTPFCEMAHRVGLQTDELLAILEEWIQDGTIRRFGAIVNHFQVGFGEGAMVVWRAPINRIAQAGRVLASFEQVSHAYERETAPGWDYNLYTMVHGATAEAVRRTVERMSEAAGVAEYVVLPTRRELKKAPPKFVE